MTIMAGVSCLFVGCMPAHGSTAEDIRVLVLGPNGNPAALASYGYGTTTTMDKTGHVGSDGTAHLKVSRSDVPGLWFRANLRGLFSDPQVRPVHNTVILRLHPVSPWSIRGRVEDSRGRALVHAQVLILKTHPEPAFPGDHPGSTNEAWTARDGTFEVKSLYPDHPDTLLVWGARCAQRVLGAPRSFATIRLKPESIIRGRVIDIEGKPVVSATVTPTAIDPSEWTAGEFTDKHGKFALHGLLRGVHRLKITYRRRLTSPEFSTSGRSSSRTVKTYRLRVKVSLDPW